MSKVSPEVAAANAASAVNRAVGAYKYSAQDLLDRKMEVDKPTTWSGQSKDGRPWSLVKHSQGGI